MRHPSGAAGGLVARPRLWFEAPGRIARAENDEVRLWLAEFSPEQIAARAPLALVAAASALAALRAWLATAQAELREETLASGDSCALTKAELRVLQLLPTHLSVPAIASRLYVSPNTVETHVRAVYRKLDASSRAEAVAHASAAGLLDDAQAA